MPLYEEALRQLQVKEETEKQREQDLSLGLDSSKSEFVHKLDNLRSNEIYSAVSQSVNSENPALLDEAVSWPGRLAHGAAKGFVDSLGDLIELPELMVNYVGSQFGWDDDDKLDMLHYVAGAIRGGVAQYSDRDTIADKIAYYVGYAVPDLAGLAFGAGAGKLAAGRVFRTTLKTGARVPAKAAETVGRMMGVIGYGAVKGGAYGGQEGAIQGAKDFTILEVANYALSGFNLPMRVLGTASIMGTLTASSVDPNRPDYEDEVIANAVLGGMFAAIPSGRQNRIAKDPELAKAKIKAYIAREKALGKVPNMNSVALEFIGRDWGYLHDSYANNPIEKSPIQSLTDNIKLHLGEEKVGKTDKELAYQLRDILLAQGDMTPLAAAQFSSSFVQSARFLSNPETIGGPAVLQQFIDLHRTRLVAPTKEPQIFQGNRIINQFGEEKVVSNNVALEYKKQAADRELVYRDVLAIEQIKNKPLSKKISAGYDALVRPESKAFDKLLDIPIIGEKLRDEIRFKGFDVYDKASAWVSNAEKRVRWDEFKDKQREALDTIVTAMAHEDIYMRERFNENTKKQKLKQVWSEEFARQQKDDALNYIRKTEGDAAVARYEVAASEIFKQFQDVNRLKLEAGIINEKTYAAYMMPKYLPGQRAVNWRPTIPFSQVEGTALLHNDPIFKENFGYTKTDAFRKGHKDEVMVFDTEYILADYLRRSHYGIAKNKLLRSWWQGARDEIPGLNEFARMPVKRYREKGKSTFLTEAEAKQILAANERLERAAKNARDRRNEKILAGEYTGRKAVKKEKSALELEKEIKELSVEVKKQEKRYARFDDHARGDFTKYDVKVPAEPHALDKMIYDSTEAYLTKKAIRDELLAQKEQLESLNKRTVLEEHIEPLAGFEAVPFLNGGKLDYVMLDRQAAHMTNLSHNISKMQSNMLKSFGYASGTIPVKFLATAINPIFPVRRWWADNKHFYLSNPNEKANILSMTKNAFMEQFVQGKGMKTSIFKDVIKNGELTQEYLMNGGAQLTMTKLAQEDIMIRHHGDAFTTGMERPKKAWEKFVTAAGWLGTNMETTIRVHQYAKMKRLGMSPEKAVRTVNDMLNFGRKGQFMRYIDSIYPFANVAAQALDAQLSSLKTNPKLFGAKLAQYTALRVGAIWAGYTLAGDVMDDVNPYQAVKNWIVPLGLTTQDADGNTNHGYLAIPTENSPFIQALDALLISTARIQRDQTDTLGFEEIIERLGDAVTMYDVASFIPTINAYKAIWKNRDPRTGDNIYLNGGYIDPSQQYFPDTSETAKGLAKIIPGASPAGLEKAGGMLGGPITGFLGYLLNDVTPEEKNAMSRTVTEAVPGLKSVIKWTRPDTSAAKRMIFEESTQRQKVLIANKMSGIERIKSGNATLQSYVRELRSNDEINSLEKQDLIKQMRQDLKGWKLYQKILDREDPSIIAEIPSVKEWDMMSGQQTSTKARWYLANRPSKDSEAYKPYLQLAKTYGFLGSRKFFYYLRQFEKGGM